MSSNNALDMVFEHLASGDVAAALEMLSEDAHIWHCFDRIAHDRAGAEREWNTFVASFPERSFSNVRSQPTASGFVRQHVMTVRTSSGQRMAWEVCVIVVMAGGLIRRLDEYIDRAGSFSAPGSSIVMRFDGKVAVVTGAGGGLGRAYALELARRGARVVVNDLSRAAAEQVVAEIVADGGAAVANSDNVASRAGGKAIVDQATGTFGRIDVLISNAGILRQAPFDEMSEADIDDVIDVHLKGAFHVGQPAFAAMKAQGYGRILLTASSSGLFGHPWQASYAAAKAGVVGLANTIALEGKPHGILCNVIMPNARTTMADGVGFGWKGEVPEVGALLDQLVALPSGGGERLDADWVVPLAMHLVSEQTETTHGIFSACSGRYARVAISAAEGWVAPFLPSQEDVAANWPQICDAGSLIEPMSVYGEALTVRQALANLA